MMENDNIFKQLENLQVPVSDEEWKAISSDPAMTKIFGKRHFLHTTAGKIVAFSSAFVILAAIPLTILFSGNRMEKSKPATNEIQSTTQTITTNNPTENPHLQTATIKHEATAPAIHESSSNKKDNTTSVGNCSQLTNTEHLTTETTALSQPTVPETTALDNTPALTPQIKKRDVLIPEKTSEPITKSTSEESETDELTYDELSDENPYETIAALENQFFIPSAFTPNGDGLNDIFYVKSNFEPTNFEIMIFSRNGDLVFHSRDMNIGWDGRYKDKTLPQGVYIYTIRHKNKDNKDEKLQGQVLLIP